MQIFAASCLLSVASPPIPGGAMVVENGRIAAVGPLAELRKSWPGPVREFPGGAIMPGLVNAHTHLELTHFPAWKIRKGLHYMPRTYADWIMQVVKIRRGLTATELAHSVAEGIAKCLETGTTTVGEILSERSLLPHYTTSALGGRIFFEALGMEPARCARLAADLYEALTSFPSARLLPGISPHAPHTVVGPFFSRLATMGKELGVPLMTHLAESPEELPFFHDTTGALAEQIYPFAGWEDYLPAPRHTTPTAFLDALEVLDANMTAVHAVQITPVDADILARRGVAVVLCPRSNERLAVGTAPAALLKKAGIPLALGTDSLASNDSLSLWDEMRFLLDKQPLFSPAEVLAMATLGGAHALRLAHEVGSIEIGKRADFLVVTAPPAVTADSLYTGIIGQSQLEHVFCAGEEL